MMSSIALQLFHATRAPLADLSSACPLCLPHSCPSWRIPPGHEEVSETLPIPLTSALGPCRVQGVREATGQPGKGQRNAHHAHLDHLDGQPPRSRPRPREGIEVGHQGDWRGATTPRQNHLGQASDLGKRGPLGGRIVASEPHTGPTERTQSRGQSHEATRLTRPDPTRQGWYWGMGGVANGQIRLTWGRAQSRG